MRLRIHREPPTPIKFEYTNWRGDWHIYVVEPESIEFGPYDASGKHSREDDVQWVLHGELITRDGDTRPDMGVRRRTFILSEIKPVTA